MVVWLGYNRAIYYRIYNELFPMTENTEKKLSPLCRTIEQDGKIIRVEIYQNVEGAWLLEVFDEFDNSTAWEDAFERV
jgi:hypothetical protein